MLKREPWTSIVDEEGRKLSRAYEEISFFATSIGFDKEIDNNRIFLSCISKFPAGEHRKCGNRFAQRCQFQEVVSSSWPSSLNCSQFYKFLESKCKKVKNKVKTKEHQENIV
jgi:hypothetical protein